MREIKREKNGYVKKLTDICEFLVNEFFMGNKAAESVIHGSMFKRLLRSSIF